MSLTAFDLEKLEKRAQTALNGYTADVNITCYVYGADVLTLIKEVRELQGKLTVVVSELQPCVTEGNWNKEQLLPCYDALGAASVRKLCTLLDVVPTGR